MTVDPASVVEVAEADVYKAGRLAARLTRTADGVAFTYVEGYDGPPVATTLPLRMDPLVRPGGALPGFFTGLLPEGRRLGALRRAVKTSVDDELSLLLAVGDDTIGDVQVVPSGAEPGVVPARVQLDAAQPVRFRDLLSELELRPDRTGLPGVQDKVSAAMINLPVARADRALILKLDPPEYPGLVENEHVLLQACAVGGLSAAEAELVRDLDGHAGLAVTRFDRMPGLNGPRSLAVEDGCQVQGRSPGDKYTVGYAATFSALAAVCDARLLAARTLLAQLVFAILSGNGDAHAKELQRPAAAGRRVAGLARLRRPDIAAVRRHHPRHGRERPAQRRGGAGPARARVGHRSARGGQPSRAADRRRAGGRLAAAAGRAALRRRAPAHARPRRPPAPAPPHGLRPGPDQRRGQDTMVTAAEPFSPRARRASHVSSTAEHACAHAT